MSADIARGPLGASPSPLGTSGLTEASPAWCRRQRHLQQDWPLEVVSSQGAPSQRHMLHGTKCWRGQRLSWRWLAWGRQRETGSSGSRSQPTGPLAQVPMRTLAACVTWDPGAATRQGLHGSPRAAPRLPVRLLTILQLLLLRPPPDPFSSGQRDCLGRRLPASPIQNSPVAAQLQVESSTNSWPGPLEPCVTCDSSSPLTSTCPGPHHQLPGLLSGS